MLVPLLLRPRGPEDREPVLSFCRSRGYNIMLLKFKSYFLSLGIMRVGIGECRMTFSATDPIIK